MKDCEFIAFLFETMLQEVFLTKANMAKELGIHYRTLQVNFQKLGRHKGGCVACQNLFLYCFRNGISVDNLYARYLNHCEGKKGGFKLRPRMIRRGCRSAHIFSGAGACRMEHNGLLQRIYQYVLDEYMDSNSRKMALELRMSEKNLNKALCNERSPEYAMLFEQLLTYCAKHYIGVDLVLKDYTVEKN